MPNPSLPQAAKTYLSIDGVLVIDKPRGPTSHDVVAAIRRALHIKKVGHTGTLDPTATGVLPLVLGQATKLARYLTGGDKTYRATVRLGLTTSTLDAAGPVTSERPVNVTADQVAAVLGAFSGDITQIPPMFSAKKIQGQKLYELARQGVEIPREAKHVKIHALTLCTLAGDELVVEVKCSAGTYVRVLAHDIGEKLGCGAHLKSLQRLAAGPFHLKDAVPLQEVLDHPELATGRVLSIDRSLADMAHIDIPPNVARLVSAGHQLTIADLRQLDVPNFAADEALVLRSDAGNVVAVVRSLVASSDLGAHRRDARAVKTERVLTPCG